MAIPKNQKGKKEKIMKKIFVLFIVLSYILLITACSTNKEYTVTLHFNYGGLDDITVKYEENEQIILPTDSDLSNSNYYIINSYSDSSYNTIQYSKNINSDMDIYVKLGKYEDINKYSYLKNADAALVEQYFITNGELIDVDTAINQDLYTAMLYQEKGYGDNFYKITSTNNWTTASTQSELLYFPTAQAVICSYTTKESDSISSIGFLYQYSGSIEFIMGENSDLATYSGSYFQTAYNLTTYSTLAYYNAAVEFEISDIKSTELTLPNFYNVNYSAYLTNANDYTQAQKSFNKAYIAEKCYAKITGGAVNCLNNNFTAISSTYTLLSK